MRFSPDDVGKKVELVIDVSKLEGNLDYEDGARVPYEAISSYNFLLTDTSRESRRIVDTSQHMKRVDSARIARALGSGEIHFTGIIISLEDEYLLVNLSNRGLTAPYNFLKEKDNDF